MTLASRLRQVENQTMEHGSAYEAVYEWPILNCVGGSKRWLEKMRPSPLSAIWIRKNGVG